MEPWEALDIDDSDLSTFLRPCNRHTSQPHSPLIPGPAGILQTAILQRRTQGASNPLPTQEFVRRVVQNGHNSDRDFNAKPWLSALHFLHSQVSVLDEDDGEAAPSPTRLSSIKNHLNDGKVDLIVAVIKSCTPNGFGDMMVTLKDTSGTVGASIHRKVFTEGEFGKDTTVGSVLLLQKVALFSPNKSSTCYLNITLPNILKVFSKDIGPTSEQISLKRTAPTSITTTESHEKSLMLLGSQFSLPQERAEEILTNIRLDSRFREVADSDKQRDEILVLTSAHTDNGNQKTVSDRENLSPRQDNSGPVQVTCGGKFQSEMKDQPNPSTLGEGDNLAGIAQGICSSTNSAHISVGQENEMKNHLEIQKEIMNPKTSIPNWTEEQLDELFAFD